MSPNSLGVCAMALAALAASCSSPAELPGRAGAMFNISGVSPGVSGKSCNTTGTTIRIPSPPEVAPSDTDIGNTVTDGKAGAQVTCKVHQAGNAFQVSATVRVATNAISVGYSVPSANATGAGDGTGTVNVVTEFGLQQSDPKTPCTFHSFQAKPGAAWAKFTCTAAFDPASPDSTFCDVRGDIALQDCAH